MEDIATIGIKVDSTDIDRGGRALDGLAESGRKAASATKAFERAWGGSARTAREGAQEAARQLNAVWAAGQKVEGVTNQQRKAAEGYIASLQKEAVLLGRSETDKRKLEVATLGLTEAERKHALVLVDKLAAYRQQEESNAAANAMAATLITRLGYMAVAAIAGAAAFTKMSISAAAAADEIENRLDVILKSAAATAKITRAEIDDLAEAMKATTKFDDDAVRDAATVMLTFKNVQGETFKEAMRSSADLAAILGGDLTSATRMLGRAFNDPEQGLMMLSRAGVQFSHVQKQMIEDYMKSGQLAEAQRIIQEKLNSTIKGAAEGVYKDYTKASGDLKKEWEDLLKAFGRTPEVKTATVAALGSIENALRQVRNLIEGKEVEIPWWLKALPGVGGGASALEILANQRAAQLASTRRRTSVGKIGGSSTAAEGQFLIEARQRFWEEYADDNNKMEKELKRAEKLFQGHGEELARAIAVIREKYSKGPGEYAQFIQSIQDKIAAQRIENETGVALTATEKQLMELEEGGMDKKLKLTVATKERAKSLLEELRALEGLEKIRKEFADRNKELLAQDEKAIIYIHEQEKAVAGLLIPLQQKADAAQHEVDTYGKTASEIERITIARLEEARAVVIRHGATPESLKDLEEELRLRRLVAGALVNKEALDKEKEAWKQREDDAKRTAENIERSLTDALMRGFEGGKDMGKNLRDTLYNMFRTLVLQPMIKPVAEGLSKGITGWMEGALKGLNFGGGGDPTNYPSSAHGNVFTASGLSVYSNSIVDRPTLFPFARGVGLMGEAGPEAIMPLKRLSGGDLGVKAEVAPSNPVTIIVNVPAGTAPEIRRAAGQGAREAVAALGRARRYA